MNKLSMLDEAISRHKEKKLSVAMEIAGTGYHEMIKNLYESGMKQCEIVREINKAAGEYIVGNGAIYFPLLNMGLIKKNKAMRVKRKHTPRIRVKDAIKTGKQRDCLQCGKIFPQTNLNHARCPECTRLGGEATEYYAVNRASGGF